MAKQFIIYTVCLIICIAGGALSKLCDNGGAFVSGAIYGVALLLMGKFFPRD